VATGAVSNGRYDAVRLAQKKTCNRHRHCIVQNLENVQLSYYFPSPVKADRFTCKRSDSLFVNTNCEHGKRAPNKLGGHE
jgi:hypothetical protein